MGLSASRPIFVVMMLACSARAQAPHHPPASPPGDRAAPVEKALASVATHHGGHGPWAVLGYRMGIFAAGRLGISPGSADIRVVHHTPRLVQYSCMADGAAAATGASVGKLNLSLVDALPAAVHTEFTRPSTGARVVLRPSESFARRFKDVPPAELPAAGRTVMELPDGDLFVEVK